MASSQLLLGIIAALPAEARTAGARDTRPGEVVPVADNVLVIRSGIGRARARRAARRLVDAGADALLSWGTAAALSPQLDQGDLVLPREVLARDGRRFRVDFDWRDRLRGTLAPHGGCHAGSVAEAERVLRDANDKQLLHALSGSLIADMESAAIAETCQGAGLPLLVVRAVSDQAATRVPRCALVAMSVNGDVKVSRCLGELVLAPRDLPALLGLAWGYRAACAALSRVSERAGPGFLL